MRALDTARNARARARAASHADPSHRLRATTSGGIPFFRVRGGKKNVHLYSPITTEINAASRNRRTNNRLIPQLFDSINLRRYALPSPLPLPHGSFFHRYAFRGQRCVVSHVIVGRSVALRGLCFSRTALWTSLEYNTRTRPNYREVTLKNFGQT